jgi:hypothetical protein
MDSDLNALGILAALALAALALVGFGRAPAPRPRIVAGAAFFVVACALLGLGTIHMCGAGEPLWQYVLPLGGAALVIAFVEESHVRYGFAALALAVAIGLSAQFLALVHSDAYTGNPRWEQRLAEARGGRADVRPLWHTPLTGLYAKR